MKRRVLTSIGRSGVRLLQATWLHVCLAYFFGSAKKDTVSFHSYFHVKIHHVRLDKSSSTADPHRPRSRLGEEADDSGEPATGIGNTPQTNSPLRASLGIYSPDGRGLWRWRSLPGSTYCTVSPGYGAEKDGKVQRNRRSCE